MDKKILVLLVIGLFLIYKCFNNFRTNDTSYQRNKVVTIASLYEGIPYRAGGTNHGGMDCSGLVCTSFKEIGISLPRSSQGMSEIGEKISLKKVVKGDLLFFRISRLKGRINHVGLVTNVNNDEVFFIHSSTSKGVIISSMKESYWKKNFVKAKRVIN